MLDGVVPVRAFGLEGGCEAEAPGSLALLDDGFEEKGLVTGLGLGAKGASSSDLIWMVDDSLASSSSEL